MNIKFIPSAINDPKDSSKWFYARGLITSNNDFESIAKEIAQEHSISEGDALATLVHFENIALKKLGKGEAVEIGRLGKLYASLSASRVQTPQEVTASTIKKAKINFRPGKSVREMLSKITFKPYKTYPNSFDLAQTVKSEFKIAETLIEDSPIEFFDESQLSDLQTDNFE
ncbi:MAG: HU family DNA-binding protein [Streptococcaceae bacterium]|jgi:predicted histone-like DNA-binding protein|nr:HU family DNA-binding protein [Streptococcaceae bacterium]